MTRGMPHDFAYGAFAPFRPVREIGRGAHGCVFIADGPNGHVALKVCQRPDDPDGIVNWERERRGWTLLKSIPPHPGLVRVFATGNTPGKDAFWVAMELADAEEGGIASSPNAYRPKTLASVADAEVALPLKDCIKIGVRLAAALEHLQRHHLLHRDIKPGNILYIRGNPVIADAGLVVDAREAASLVGTPGYVPPENHGSPQGDVFSLGKTLWRIATGRSPDETSFAPCAEADTADPLFGEFMGILLRAMSPSPAKRFRSAKALRKALVRLRRKMAQSRIDGIVHSVLTAFGIAFLLLIVLAYASGIRIFPNYKVPAFGGGGDPLDPLRDGIRSGKIHILTDEEAEAIGRDAQRVVDEAASNLWESVRGMAPEVQ